MEGECFLVSVDVALVYERKVSEVHLLRVLNISFMMDTIKTK